MYHLDCLLTKDQYAILEDALYYYSESKSEANDDAKVIAIEQLETLIEESARKFPYETFPIRLETKEVVCHFQCMEHAQTYIKRHKLRKPKYKLEERPSE